MKSGKAYRQPVSYARDGETLLTPAAGGGRSNLKDGRQVRLRLRGRDVSARADLVSRPGRGRTAAGRHRRSGNPRAMRFIPIPRPADGRLEPGRRSPPPSATASASSAGTWNMVCGLRAGKSHTATLDLLICPTSALVSTCCSNRYKVGARWM